MVGHHTSFERLLADNKEIVVLGHYATIDQSTRKDILDLSSAYLAEEPLTVTQIDHNCCQVGLHVVG